MAATIGTVLFGDVVASRRDAAASSAWLRELCGELEGAYPLAERLAGFGFTQGDELQGLLAVGADPFRAILIAALHEHSRRMRWVIAAGPVEPGPGPATERTGEAFLEARTALEAARAQRDGLLVTTGEPGADRLLENLAPLLAELLAALTPRQRTVGRLVLLEGLRQADVAERLHIARATVSVVHARGRIRSIGRLASALQSIFRAGTLALAESTGER
jgi:DNA-directed RNA polymerase specialized sigma24 family protein